MSAQHPITPPTELVRQWSIKAEEEHQPTVAYSMVSLLAAKAARWGADQELEACCKWLDERAVLNGATALRADRRPKPPSLKEQALALVQQHEEGWRPSPKDWDTIYRALEALDD
jgi:hypothetical protein